MWIAPPYVVAPPAPVTFAFFLDAQAAAAATVAELKGVDHLQLDAVQLNPVPVDVVHGGRSCSGGRPLTETAPQSQRQPRDYSMGVLTLAVITLALFLGWMMGYVRSPGTKARTLKNIATQPAQPKPVEAALLPISRHLRAPRPLRLPLRKALPNRTGLVHSRRRPGGL